MKSIHIVSSLLLIALLSGMVACSDDLGRGFGGGSDDGVMRFRTGSEFETRAARSLNPEHRWLGVERCDLGTDAVYLHVTSLDNASGPQSTPARSMPLNSLDRFQVTATVEQDGIIKTMIADQTVTKKGSLWETENQYYWPEEPVTFYAHYSKGDDETAPILSSSDITRGSGTMTFSYKVGTNKDHDPAAQADIIMAGATVSKSALGAQAASAGKQLAVDLDFSHPLTGICFVKDDDFNYEVTKVEITNLYGEATCVFDPKYSDRSTRSIWKDYKGGLQNYSCIDLGEGDARDVAVSPSATVQSLCSPFMVLPHDKQTLRDNESKIRVTISSGKTVELDAYKFGDLEPGRIYCVRLSKRDANYPPVNNQQGALGNNTVSLQWTEPTDVSPNSHQIGVKIDVQQTREVNGTVTHGPTVSRYLYDNNSRYLSGDWPDKTDLPYYGLIENTENDSAEPKISTLEYNQFTCNIYALYYNENDPKEADGTRPVYSSSPATVSLTSTVTSKEVVAFYLPNNLNTEDPVASLLDDDDKAAAAWFKEAFQKGIFVNADKMQQYAEEGSYPFDALWFPCGVSSSPVGDWWDQGLIDTALQALGNGGTKDMEYNAYKDNILTKFQAIMWHKGMYNDEQADGSGRIKTTAREDYITENDRNCIKAFYGQGGNLLLTTFAISWVYEFGVITANCQPYDHNEFRPYYHLFNEVKQPSFWFVRSNFGDHNCDNHPIFDDLFKMDPRTLPEYALNTPENENSVVVCGDNPVAMWPLLSRDARTCENNNVVWDFNNQAGKRLGDFEDNNSCRVLGTWGQIDNLDIAAIVEFYPGENRVNDAAISAGRYDRHGLNAHEAHTDACTNHGRCICIGLGAYEFNNGLRYDPAQAVLNRYQSNVQLLTRNALQYLLKNKDRKQ